MGILRAVASTAYRVLQRVPHSVPTVQRGQLGAASVRAYNSDVQDNYEKAQQSLVDCKLQTSHFKDWQDLTNYLADNGDVAGTHEAFRLGYRAREKMCFPEIKGLMTRPSATDRIPFMEYRIRYTELGGQQMQEMATDLYDRYRKITQTGRLAGSGFHSFEDVAAYATRIGDKRGLCGINHYIYERNRLAKMADSQPDPSGVRHYSTQAGSDRKWAWTQDEHDESVWPEQLAGDVKSRPVDFAYYAKEQEVGSWPLVAEVYASLKDVGPKGQADTTRRIMAYELAAKLRAQGNLHGVGHVFGSLGIDGRGQISFKKDSPVNAVFESFDYGKSGHLVE